jgi:hypothetical protein
MENIKIYASQAKSINRATIETTLNKTVVLDGNFVYNLRYQIASLRQQQLRPTWKI